MHKREKSDMGKTAEAQAIVFGFDRDTDEQSLLLFLQRFSDERVLAALLPRLPDEDIVATVDFLTALMQNHLSEQEYHELFLAS